MGLLRVVLFGDADDNVHHIRHTTTAFGATVELVIDLCRDHQLPRISNQQIENDVLNLLGRDHIALADEHGFAEMDEWSLLGA
ncbi:hypothetical protein WH87_02815 [Devosia epidermidihirudinis]|uniref:Uncharacterized protein n=1 Tax=Devosia epidermidihirudinis TaxID=1293439 RepID=A0A0F5QJC2_9HYPH|nr:hypothetical protein WH87_02815 [Devosia epidermidihirudinis]